MAQHIEYTIYSEDVNGVDVEAYRGRLASEIERVYPGAEVSVTVRDHVTGVGAGARVDGDSEHVAVQDVEALAERVLSDVAEESRE